MVCEDESNAPQLRRFSLGSDEMDLPFISYLVLGALFAFVASRVLKMGGWWRIVLATASAVVLLLVAGLWLESQAPSSERAMGFPILVALLSPSLAVAVVWIAAIRGSSMVWQWVVATFGWTAGFVVTSFAALSLNWITF